MISLSLARHINLEHYKSTEEKEKEENSEFDSSVSVN
jgi:hypothetical protein